MFRLYVIQKHFRIFLLKLYMKFLYCNTNMKYEFRLKKWFDRIKLYLFQIYITILTILLLSLNVKILSVR